MKGSSNLKITVWILITINLASCVNNADSGQLISNQDVKQVINTAINFAVDRYENPDFRIAPYFHSELTDSIIINSFFSAEGISYDNNKLNEFAEMYLAGEGVNISPWISDNEKQNRISDEFHDLLIVVSSPMIDNEKRRVFLYVQTYYPDFDYNIRTLASFIGFELKTEKVSGGLELGSISAFTNFQPIFPSSKDSVPILPPSGVSISSIQMN